MKKILKDSSGFGAVEIILILVVVSLMGGVGWYVIQSKNKTTKTQNESIKTPTSQQTQDNAKYLEIKEWGVKFKVPNEVSDLTYDQPVANGKSDPDGSSVQLTTPGFQALADTMSTCGGIQRRAALGILYKEKPNTKSFYVGPKNETYEQMAERLGDASKTIGDNFYYYDTTHWCGEFFSTDKKDAVVDSIKNSLTNN